MQTNIDNSATLSELKKDFNAVLLEKQARKMIKESFAIREKSFP